MAMQEVNKEQDLQNNGSNLHIIKNHIVVQHVYKCVFVVIENEKIAKMILEKVVLLGSSLLNNQPIISNHVGAVEELQLI